MSEHSTGSLKGITNTNTNHIHDVNIEIEIHGEYTVYNPSSIEFYP